MPRYTVVGHITTDDMRLIVDRVFRGERADKVPPMPGWGHILSAPSREAARRRARDAYANKALGHVVFDLEITHDQPQRHSPGRFRWPWQRRQESAPPVRTRNIPYV